MLLTEQEEELFQEFVGNISKNLGVKVNTSNLLRASLALLLHSERELLKQCRRVDYMRKKRPRNDQPTEIATFEENLARLFDSAIRNSEATPIERVVAISRYRDNRSNRYRDNATTDLLFFLDFNDLWL